MSIAIISLTPAFLALMLAAVRKQLASINYSWGIAAFIGVLFFWLLTLLPEIRDNGATIVSTDWVPALGLTLSLYLDGLSLTFSLIILGVGAVVTLYAGYYFDDMAELNRFYSLLLAFMSAMLAVVLAGNILMLFIAWEMTSILSFLLISFNSDRPEARSGALQAMIITGGGGLALVTGLVLMGTAANSMELGDLLSNTSLHESPWYTAFTLLILLGCFTKSAQFPFHFWLPDAMSAPTPASAYLHSATMVKAGIYLLLRLYPVLGESELWQNLLLVVGLATLLIGAFFALRQRDLKAGLAYSTISQLGAFVVLISLPDHKGIEAALVGIIAHSLYKAALFLTVGAVDHTVGTRNLDSLGGLAHVMPGWAAIAVISGLSMAGIPPLLGFVAKEALLHAVLDYPIALAVVVLSAAFTVAMALILTVDVFWGTFTAKRDHLHLLPDTMLIGPALLAAGSLFTGILLPLLVIPLITPALHHESHLSLFSGINTPLMLSLVAVAAGAGIFALRATWRQWPMPKLPAGHTFYQKGVSLVEQVGSLALRSQSGKLRYYLVVILCAVTGLQAMAGLSHIDTSSIEVNFEGSTDILSGLLLLLALGAMLASILFKKHLLAALALGVGGYSVGGLFMLQPAPDVALVQFMVETLGTVLLIVMLARIKPEEREQAMDSLWHQSRFGLARDVVISVVIGTGVGLFAFAAVTSRPKPESIATWHLENTITEVSFPDVVGAIVTDFRGMDTIIEISVFSVAALGVLTIIAKGGVNAPDKPALVEQETPEQDSDLFAWEFSTPLTRVIAQFVLPFAFLVALAQLLYGGDGPGDGFTAGVISGLGITLWYVVFGYHEARRRLYWLHERGLIGAGLALVIGNAIMPMLGGEPFLAHINFDQIHLPANLHISSTLFYETGIFLTVLGSVGTVMESIAYPKEVELL